MKRGRKSIYIGVALCLVASLLVFGCAEPAPAPAPSPAPAPAPAPAPKPTEPIVLKGVTFLRMDEPTNDGLWIFVDKVNERAKGELVLEFSGPEAVPGFEQFPAVRSGAVDMAHVTENWYGADLTGTSYAHYSELTPAEERANGYYDFRVELLKNFGVYYVGHAAHTIWFNLYTNKKFEKPWDIAGQKIRVAPIYVAFVKALGGTPVMMPPPDIYTALERGVVDGFGWSAVGVVGFGWHEVSKYIVAPNFYQGATELTVNLDTWNKLPKHLQDIMVECMIETEIETVEPFRQASLDERQVMLDSGMELIEFSPEDTKWYVDLAYSAGWEDVTNNIDPPELAPKLKEFLTK